MTPAPAALPDTSVCPRCGLGLRCGMVAGDADCWCVRLPHVMPVPAARASLLPAGSEAAASCYCPACLQQITNERQAKLLSPAPD